MKKSKTKNLNSEKEFRSPLLIPKNPSQKQLMSGIDDCQMTIATGVSGTGKTFIAAAKACEYYKSGKVKKIIITRPTIPVGRSIGFYPGTLEEKLGPWLSPVTEAIKEFLGKGVVETGLKNGTIEFVPFEVIRGRTFKDCFVILDEAQNTTKEEIQAFVTRIGENSKIVVCGDVKQSDIKVESGLAKIVDLVNKHEYLQERVFMIDFDSSEVVRSDLCSFWVKAFD